MGVLSDKWRERATELNKALAALLEKPDINSELVQATKAAVLPELLNVLADMLQVLEETTALDEKTSRLAEWSKRQQSIRLAAAKAIDNGDWSEFDRIIDGTAETDAD